MMKRLSIWLLTMLLASTSLVWGETLTVVGIVMDEATGAPVPQHAVNISIDSTAVYPGYFNTVYTGMLGNFEDIIELPDFLEEGIVTISTFDCNNAMISYDLEFGPGNYNLMVTFQICTGTIPPNCEANFFWMQSWEQLLTVEFYDFSWFEPGTWYWEFGDGETSDEQNSVHVYAGPGEYEVCLTITSDDSVCVDTYCEMVFVEEFSECNADFWGYSIPGSYLTYLFEDYSFPYATAWNWDFGDGTTSTEQNPVHGFAEPGVYNICLTMFNEDLNCEDTQCYEFTVDTNNIWNECYAHFSWFQVDDLTMQFEDFSWPDPTTWNWDFGDGETSTEQNPIHIYPEYGMYNVCLTITSEELGCEDTQCYEVSVDSTGQGYECHANFWWYQLEDLNVQFEDFSWPDPTTWNWDFGDGETSTEQNPIHQYAEAGLYTVTLTIFVEEINCESTTTWDVWVEDFNWDCMAGFFWLPSWEQSLTVEFYDFSWFEPGTWYWEFGDGETSTEQNPTHTYAEPGEYEVCLTIASDDSTCVDTFCEMVFVEEFSECNAEFWWYPIGDLTIQFEDFSWPEPTTYLWEFGDGETSVEPNPIHIYPEVGTYEVCLTITNEELGCEDTQCYEVWVDSTGQGYECIADFWGYPTPGSYLTYQFEDYSFPYATAWNWDFGDGTTSTEQNPVHGFAETGVYNVCLTMFNEDLNCEDTQCYEFTVDTSNVPNECYAQFFWFPLDDLTIQFEDYSWPNPTTYFWEFGDGETSIEPNPIHIYPEYGMYNVCLTITSEELGCEDTQCYEISVDSTGTNWECFADFLYNQEEGFVVQFTDYSWPNPTSWYWEFGDGETSVEQNPVHAYSEEGYYNVCLTMESQNPGFICTSTTCYEIYVYDNGGGDLLASFEYIQDSANTQLYYFFDTSTGGPIGWLWEFGDGEVSQQQNPVHEFAEPGTYEICLTIYNNYDTDIYCEQIEMATIFNGVASVSVINSAGNIFPNPGSSQISLNFSISKSTPVKFIINNFIGQMVYSADEYYNAGSQKKTINIADLPEGIYSLKLITNTGQVVTRKFIKVK